MLRTLLLAICSVLVVSGGMGCGSVQVRSTVYTASDMEYASTEIRDQLASSDFLRDRDAGSARMVLMPLRMQNLSNERISRVDQWAAVTRVFMDPSVLKLLQSKNIEVVLPPEGERVVGAYIRDAEGQGLGQMDGAGAQKKSAATHLIDAQFSSITRAVGEDDGDDLADIRKDLFIINYTIVSRDSLETVWTGSNEFARVARGLMAN